jgi:3-hydroxyisobutyrate dehydrogenase
MGEAMIMRLLGAGHSVTVYNRTPEKASRVIEAGAHFAPTPRAAVEQGGDAVFASLIDDDASRAVWTGPDGVMSAGLAPGSVVVECSTLSHGWVMELNGIARERGLRFLDCPVAGRPDFAAAGKLVVFVGGEERDLEEIRRFLEPLSREVLRFGGPGSGTAFKLIYNLMGATHVAALAEGLVAAEAAGLDLHVAAHGFSTGATGSPHVVRHAAFMSEGRHEKPVAFTGRGRLKDSTYGVEFTEQLGCQAIVGNATVKVFQQMVDIGMAEANDSMIIDAIRRIKKETRR